jgi:hypothetical protein
VSVLAEGRTAEGEGWQLVQQTDPQSDTVTVHLTSPDGHPYWSTGCGLPDRPLDGLVALTTGSDELGPAGLLLRLRTDVRAAVVLLSDGTREDLRPLPARDDRVAVLVHPRRLEVHRIDLHDAGGTRLPDPGPTPAPGPERRGQFSPAGPAARGGCRRCSRRRAGSRSG